jgi:hypothetical protein
LNWPDFNIKGRRRLFIHFYLYFILFNMKLVSIAMKYRLHLLRKQAFYSHLYTQQATKYCHIFTNLSLICMIYLRNRKHFPCFYRVIETCVKVWEKREIVWEHEHKVQVFPRNFEFLPNFHKCFYKLYRNMEKMFSFYFLY